MTVIVEVPGHGEVEFPDGMSDADMEAAIRKNFMMAQKEPPKQQSNLQRGLMAPIRGLVSGGPLGAIGAIGKEASRQQEEAAYDAGGKVTDWTGSPGLGYAANVLTQAVPAVLGGQVAPKAMTPALQGTARTFMQSALKPSKLDHQSGRAARATQTMLDEGATVSQGGVDKLRSSIATMNDEIAGIIKDSDKTISKNAVADRLQNVLKKYEAGDPDDLKAVEAVWTKFLTHPSLAGKDEIPVQFAQRMKQSFGSKLGDAAYGMGLKPAGERDAWKGITRGLKEEIAAAEPAVAPLNARESALINASKIASNRVAMDANKNPLGLWAAIGQPWMLPLWAWDRSPAAKSLTARMLYSGANEIGTATGAGLGGLYGANQGTLYK
jgi:hypothetical protein